MNDIKKAYVNNISVVKIYNGSKIIFSSSNGSETSISPPIINITENGDVYITQPQGYTIKYKIEQHGSENTYNSYFNVQSGTTIYSWAINDGKSSSIVSATFTRLENETLQSPSISINTENNTATIKTFISGAVLYYSKNNESDFISTSEDTVTIQNVSNNGDIIRAYITKDGKISNVSKKTRSPLSGKIVLGLGDSYLENEHDTPDKTWLAKVCDECGATYIYTCSNEGYGWKITDTAVGGNCLVICHNSSTQQCYEHTTTETLINPNSNDRLVQIKDDLYCFEKVQNGTMGTYGTGIPVVERLDFMDDNSFATLTGKHFDEIDYVILVGGRNDYSQQLYGSYDTTEILKVKNNSKTVRVGRGFIGYATPGKSVIKRGTIIRTISDSVNLSNCQYSIVNEDLQIEKLGDGSHNDFVKYLKQELSNSCKILADKIKHKFPNAKYCYSTAWATVGKNAAEFSDGSYGYGSGESRMNNPLSQYDINECYGNAFKNKGFYVLNHSTAYNNKYINILRTNNNIVNKVAQIKNLADNIVFTNGEPDKIDVGSPIVMYYPEFRKQYEQEYAIDNTKTGISHLNEEGHKLLVTYVKNFLESI